MMDLYGTLLVLESVVGERERAYVKSAGVADQLDPSTRSIAARIVEIRDSGEIPVEIEKWSQSTSGATWAVEIPDHDAFEAYLDELRAAGASV